MDATPPFNPIVESGCEYIKRGKSPNEIKLRMGFTFREFTSARRREIAAKLGVSVQTLTDFATNPFVREYQPSTVRGLLAELCEDMDPALIGLPHQTPEQAALAPDTKTYGWTIVGDVAYEYELPGGKLTGRSGPVKKDPNCNSVACRAL
ncbi:hypothetical protein [Mesorhizobium sp. B4-1-4]|uniref:hypothetical protein n=1 Tax=Mesorhizobium sp. B4-1-4 TaxID=2589888 RepID=UPI00112AC5D9|nr:hypothetical protein [Mesorhizobium sp. B4-1-4]UCI32527.1 hypothetical protein FJW03_03470 [Mesorhizobium sp. B4-1-4]